MNKGYLHQLPGRLRARVPGLRGNYQLAAGLNELLSGMSGITRVSANPLTGNILVHFNPAFIDNSSVIINIENIRKNKVTPLSAKARESAGLPVLIREPEDLPLGRQVLQVMLSGAVLLVLFFKHRIFGRSALSYSQGLFNVAAVTTVVTGYPILYSGVQHLSRRRRINYDLVISAATLSLLVLRESFTGLLVTWLVNLSALLQTLNLVKSHQEIKKAVGVIPQEVWLLVNGSEVAVPAHRVMAGDTVAVHPGEAVPVDGKVISGQAAVNESRITGSPHPVYKDAGAPVLAGSEVMEGTLQVKVERAGKETFLYQTIQNVNYQLSRHEDCHSPECLRSDRLVSLSLLLAGAVYLLTRNAGRSLAMVLAACPSAAGLAASTAVGAAVGSAANRGIYIKDGKYLLAAGQLDTVVFDKTGTLTAAQAEVQEVTVVNKNYSKEEIIALAALAEGITGHPFARAVRDKAVEMHMGPLPAAEEISFIPGLGVKARVDYKQVLVGNERLMAEEMVAVGRVKTKIMRFRHLGLSPVFVAVEGKLCGLLGVREILKPESRQAVEQLRAAGITKMMLLTGDTQEAAEMTAGQLGIEEAHGSLQAEQKAAFIRSLKEKGHLVAVVGDGINDAMAMAAADTGIALGCTGMDSAVCAGGIVIPAPDPRLVVETVRLAQETREVTKQNYNFAIGLNVIGLALGAAGLITPLGAGLFTNIGTVAVIFNSMGLVKNRAARRHDKRCRKGSPPPGGSGKARPAARGDNSDRVVVSNWHVLDVGDVLRHFSTHPAAGLIPEERELRLQRYGVNRLVVEKRISWFTLLVEPFKDFMVQLLLGASVVSVLVGEYADAMTIVVIVGLEAVLGVIQGLRAEKSMAALKKLATPTAKVLVDGKLKEIRADELVPGDIVLLDEGDSIPADCRLITAADLEVEEASLTGESLPVRKDPGSCGEPDTMLADRVNMLFMGTGVTRGRGTAVVIGTGMQTEMGRLAGMLQAAETEQTPLQLQLEQLGKQLAVGCLAVCGGVVAVGLLRGRPVMEMLRTGVSLAVGAIPEGLPAVVTIALAFGVQRMVKGNAIVRNLPAVETLGGATVICTDKTGTLTKNEMTVTEIYSDGYVWQVTGEGYLPEGEFMLRGQPVNPVNDKNLCRTLTAAALCNNANISYTPGAEPDIHGDPTEVALLTAALKGGLPWPGIKDTLCRHREIAFDATRKMMTVVCHDPEGRAAVYTKGAPDHVLNRCTRVYKKNKIVSLDLKTRNEILAANEGMAAKALRVLAVACKTGEDGPGADEELEQDLIFIGLLGMVDPPRPGVSEAIARCAQAGVKVVMVTGDHPVTARAIAGQLGLLREGLILTGRELDKMTDVELLSVIDRVDVCSRTTPEHKLRIVRAFKHRGHVVAMTGDGVNDAPAVKEANIGIAMGRKGTDVTREAADITLTDDNFATIVTAVEEGRTVGDNIRKSMRYVLAGNFGEVLAIFLAAVSGMPMPLVPSQILWVNLVTESVPAMALGADPPEPGVMQRLPRRADESLLAGGLGNKIVNHGLLTGLTTFGVFAGTWMLGGGLAKARTMAFANLVVSQLFNLFDCRQPAGDSAANENAAGNKLLAPSAGISAGLLLAAVYVPSISPLFQTVPLGLRDWTLLLLTSGLVGRVDKLFAARDALPAPAKPVLALPAPLPVISAEPLPLGGVCFGKSE